MVFLPIVDLNLCPWFLILQLKEEVELQKQMNIAELNDLDEITRIEIEGFRIGTYLRLEIHDVPYEMVEYFDPYHPILVGGVGFGEESTGYMQVRLEETSRFFGLLLSTNAFKQNAN